MIIEHNLLKINNFFPYRQCKLLLSGQKTGVFCEISTVFFVYFVQIQLSIVQSVQIITGNFGAVKYRCDKTVIPALCFR